MPLVHALFLGLLQGVTEFLPVSSSGHLALAPWLFGWDDFAGKPELENAFDVALHLGTLAGAVVYLRSDIVRYATAGFGWVRKRDRLAGDAATGVFLLVTAVPTGLLGVGVLAVTEDLGDRIWLVALCLILFGLLLGWADRRPTERSLSDLGMGHAVLLGVAQGLAFQPGVSRSGVTLTVARFFGLAREEAARLVFLMSLPVIAGAGLIKASDLQVPSGWRAAFLVGTLAAAVSGWLAVSGMIRLVAHRNFDSFVVYRVLLGSGVLLLLASGVR